MKKAFWLASATRIKANPHTTVENLLIRKKKLSLRFGASGFTKSMVETDASEVRAELTEDIAADRIATIRKPFSKCGTSVTMNVGKMKSLALMPGRGSGSGILNGWLW